MSPDADAVRNLGRWYAEWTRAGATGRDPFDLAGSLAICAALAVTAAVRSPEWGDYWVATITSARRLQYGSSTVQAVADMSATATLASLPASVASQGSTVGGVEDVEGSLGPGRGRCSNAESRQRWEGTRRRARSGSGEFRLVGGPDG